MAVKKISNTQLKENLSATLQAIVANDSLRVEFAEDLPNNFFKWNQSLVVGDSAVLLPEVLNSGKTVSETGFLNLSQNSFLGELENEGEDFAKPILHQDLRAESFKHRAAGDLAVCYLLAHDSTLHGDKNRDLQEQKFFDEFEKIRVVAQAKNSYRGVVQNVLQKVESDIYSGSNSLSLLLISEIFSDEILPRTKDFALDVKKNLSKKLAAEIKKLSQLTSNQSDFELGVERVLEMLKSEEKLSEEKNEQEKSEENSQKKLPDDLNNSGAETVESEIENSTSDEEESLAQQVEKEQKIADFKEDDSKGKAAVKLDQSGFDEDKIQFKNPYKIFTNQFDEVIFPQKLIGKNELESLRDQLDLKMAKLSGVSRKMNLKLKRKLLSKKNSFSEVDSSRGILDRKKLVRLVTDPLSEDVWITNKTHEYQDTCLTILLDNSGSMRGNPIVVAALACEIIAEILEKFSVKTEIIGFTTADWKGGRARKLWERSGRTYNPGRLNELRHIVYKHFNQSLKKSKINLGLMLKEGILKENIDGEALLFARSRLMQRNEKRKILMVISDGTPVDDSTVSANDSDILSDHLRQVIRKTSQKANVEIVGIGIGHSTDDFYRNSLVIRSLEELGDGMIEKLAELL